MKVRVENGWTAADDDDCRHQNRHQVNERAHGAGVFQISEHWTSPPWLRSLGWTQDSRTGGRVCQSPLSSQLVNYKSNNKLQHQNPKCYPQGLPVPAHGGAMIPRRNAITLAVTLFLLTAGSALAQYGQPSGTGHRPPTVPPPKPVQPAVAPLAPSQYK